MAGMIIPPGDTESVWLGGIGVVFKLAGEQTGGLFSIVEHPIDPGILVRPHMHTREDEFSYVLEGEIGVRIGDQTFQASPGSYIIKPRGIPHTYWNAGNKPGRIIEIISPAGIDTFFEELAGLLKVSIPPDMTKYMELNSRYGMSDFGMEWIPDLVAQFPLKLQGK